MKTLSTMQVYPPVPAAPAPLPISFPYIPSYDFQVAEYVDEADKIVKVELQVKEYMHDQYGNVTNESNWTAVPRVKVKL